MNWGWSSLWKSWPSAPETATEGFVPEVLGTGGVAAILQSRGEVPCCHSALLGGSALYAVFV